jgi:hypothetical protein
MALLDDVLGRRSGRIGPAAFLAIGFSLLALEFALDPAVATLGFGRGGSVMTYLNPNETYTLSPLPGGRTRLAGTTWYEHRMWPQAYWRWWSDFLIHRIHARVLEHVKDLSE